MVLFPSVFGPGGPLAPYFLSPDKLLFALGFLIPLILLYLIRPKPVNVAVPSLMFILKDMGKSNVHRLFRTLFRDILFLIQVLAVLLLALSLAKPFIEVDQESLVQQSILIIDDSASTRAFGGDRFDEIKARAAQALSRENVIILAHRNPQLLQRGDDIRLGAGDAEDLIDDLEPTDIDGDLPTALDLAAQHVGPDSKVTIVSDFVLSRYESEELIEAKIKVLRSRGALVELVPVTGEGSNIGIVDAQLQRGNATLDLKVQNFNDQPEEIGLEYNGETISLPQNVLAPRGRPGSLLSISVPLGHGTSEITLIPSDDFETDNTYYVSIPEQQSVEVLMITNDANVRQSRVIPALTAASTQFTRVNIAYGTPPKVPDLEHNIYLIKDVNTQFVLPGVIKDLQDKVEEGAVLVVFAQPGLFGLDFSGLLPVEPKPDAPALGGRQELLVNSSLALMRGLSDIGQADGGQLLRVRATEDAIVYASVATNDGPEPVIAARRLGKGAVIYYGIRDQPAHDLDPQSYAIVWGRIVDYSMVDPMTLNIGTGAVLTHASGRIRTPDGTVDAPALAARSGTYVVGPSVLAANLRPLQSSLSAAPTEDLNAKHEGDIGTSAQPQISEDVGGPDGEGADTKVPKDLSTYAIIAGLAVLIFELLFIKYRGDL